MLKYFTEKKLRRLRNCSDFILRNHSHRHFSKFFEEEEEDDDEDESYKKQRPDLRPASW
jgi:hypothetical protein